MVRTTQTALVTGGCGFIGSHLVRSLLAEGLSVIVVDDLSTGSKDALLPQAELVVGDITDPSIFDSLLPRVDKVYHLAAIASVERSRTDWFRAHSVNIGGTVNLFHAIAKGGQRQPVVYASSAAIYGDARTLPIAETIIPAPLSAYGIDKLACEWHGRLAFDLHGIPNAGMRFFNVYGPGQDPKSPYSGVISIFMDRARRGDPLTIFGDGGQSRDFVFVADVVKTLRLSMRNILAGSLRQDVFNVGTGRPITVSALAEQIVAISGKGSELRYAEPREGEIRYSYCDNRHAGQALGFVPETSLEAGLKATYEGRI